MGVRKNRKFEINSIPSSSPSATNALGERAPPSARITRDPRAFAITAPWTRMPSWGSSQPQGTGISDSVLPSM